jgi:hypothetical protein
MSPSFDFDSLSEPQIDALANVAFGGRGAGLYRQTARSLVKRGLIVEVVRREGGFRWVEYEMPLAVHVAFCYWCRDREEVAA